MRGPSATCSMNSLSVQESVRYGGEGLGVHSSIMPQGTKMEIPGVKIWSKLSRISRPNFFIRVLIQIQYPWISNTFTAHPA
jgi:hypothetical protein